MCSPRRRRRPPPPPSSLLPPPSSSLLIAALALAGRYIALGFETGYLVVMSTHMQARAPPACPPSRCRYARGLHHHHRHHHHHHLLLPLLLLLLLLLDVVVVAVVAIVVVVVAHPGLGSLYHPNHTGLMHLPVNRGSIGDLNNSYM